VARVSDAPERPAAVQERVRIVEAKAEHEPGSQVRTSVELSFGDRSYVATSEGIGTETMEIRLAALATLEALIEVTGAQPFLLVGIKLMHAFDADVILVALRDPAAEGSRYIGAVAVRTTHVAAAAAAVLDATNRVLFCRGKKTA
jgi:hypothetical protein